jgi:hypothetical protein
LTARLTVTRDGPDDVKVRQVNLRLDGEGWATLEFGRAASREIAPGRHRLEAHNTFAGKTAEFEAAPGEEVRFRVQNVAGFGTWLIWVLGAGPLYVRLEREGP